MRHIAVGFFAVYKTFNKIKVTIHSPYHTLDISLCDIGYKISYFDCMSYFEYQKPVILICC